MNRQMPDGMWPIVVVRAPSRTWIRSLTVLGALVVAASAMVIVEAVEPGVPLAVVQSLVLLAFVGVVVCLAAITVRWRTSVRCDGVNLVVRDPLGARVIPLHAQVAFARWLDPRSRRPVLWVTDHRSLVTPLSPLLSSVRLEAFALTLGIAVLDVDDPPSSRRSLGDDTPG